MNKPATKEPSMDEILSSIRQIIADDDASVAPAPKPAPVAAAPAMAPVAARPAPVPPPRPVSEPLALSPSQIVSTPAPQDLSAMLGQLEDSDENSAMQDAGVEDYSAADFSLPEADEAELIDPEDIAFEVEPEEPAPAPVKMAPPPRPAMPVSRAAPMPDPTLSEEMAEKLLAPATDAAVQNAMSRLGSVADTGMRGLTVEQMMRDMLRPMLKDWLDENLPALVETMVEREIARISRGVK